MRAEGRDPLTCPAVAMACQQAVLVEDAGNQIVRGNEHQLAHRGDGLGSGAVALTPAPLRQAKLCMRTADPVDQQNDLGGCVVEIGNHLLDDGADDPLLEPDVRCRCRPDRPKVRPNSAGVECREGR